MLWPGRDERLAILAMPKAFEPYFRPEADADTPGSTSKGGSDQDKQEEGGASLARTLRSLGHYGLLQGILHASPIQRRTRCVTPAPSYTYYDIYYSHGDGHGDSDSDDDDEYTNPNLLLCLFLFIYSSRLCYTMS